MSQERESHFFDYSAFGLNFRSQLELPELYLGRTPGPGSVSIEFGSVPEKLQDATDRGGVYQVKPGRFLLKMKGVGRYLVEDGERIIVQPENGVNEEDLRVFLLGSSFGALLHQRGILALHASAVVIDGGAVLFTGLSGAGKSTTAAAFQAQGHQILADDITAISLQDGKLVAHPGLLRLKLWRDAVTNLNYNPKTLKNVRPTTIHRFVLPATDFCPEPMPLRAIFNLSHWNQDKFKHQLIENLSSFNALLHNTYRARYLQGLETRPDHFKLASSVSKQVPVYRLCRPDQPFQIEELMSIVRDYLA